MNDKPWLTGYPEGLVWDQHFAPKPLYTLLDDAVARAPTAPYLDFLGRTYSYGEIAAAVNRFAKGLQQMGLGQGTTIGLFLPNCPQYVVAYYGALKAGCRITNFSPLYSVPELVHQVEDSHTDYMVCLDVASLYETVSHVLEASRLKALIVGSLAAALPWSKGLLYRMFKRKEQAKVTPDKRHLRFESLMENDGAYRPVAIDPEVEVAVLQYTGGTTGTPKGAMLTHANLYCNARQVAASDPNLRFGTDRMLGALPFFHVFANTVVLNLTTLAGGEIVMLPKFELTQAMQAIVRRKVTVVPGVPTMFTKMLEHPKLDKFDLSSIRTCISGGAPLPVELKRQFEAKSGAIVAEGYGLTECSGVAAVNPFTGVNKPGSIGLPIPGTSIIVVDREDPDRVLPQGEAGEICIVGPQVMVGYWQRPDASAATLRGGRLHTGDVGYLDDQGYAFIIDRIKDMISVGGFKVFPRKIEEVLYEHPAILEASVIPMADPVLGERPKAVIVLRPEFRATVQEADVRAFLAPKLGKHELPGAIVFRDELPKTMIGKISKKDLIAQEAALAAAA
jgi:long-chain acyl-CoA synthetase